MPTCVHCGRPAGAILTRDGKETPFMLTFGTTAGLRPATRGVCNDCFWARADAVIASIVAAQERHGR